MDVTLLRALPSESRPWLLGLEQNVQAYASHNAQTHKASKSLVAVRFIATVASPSLASNGIHCEGETPPEGSEESCRGGLVREETSTDLARLW